ncbi:uncharacterized protein LOC141858106 [Brevipalpus obovatus]|uniref:uncharacterized protein LOC141858106 n=1 Tax=Brevipalpus obovatus TaxID=246614 RepID=UPI003D9F4402
MDHILVDKLVTAVRVILYKQLKDNYDDSFTQKIVDLASEMSNEMSQDQLKSLLFVVQKALEDSEGRYDDEIDLATGFRLLGTLAINQLLIDSDQSIIVKCLEQLKKFLAMFESQNKPSYNIRWSYLVCLNKLCSTNDGCLAVAKDLGIMQTIFESLNQNAGFYVQSEAKNIIVEMIRKAAGQPDLEKPIDFYIRKILQIECEAFIECLEELIQGDHVKTFLMNKYQLASMLIDRMDAALSRPKILCSYCRIFGRIVHNVEDFKKLTSMLTTSQQSKPLMSLYDTCLASESCIQLQDWFFIVVYPLVAEYQLSEAATVFIQSSNLSSDSQAKKMISEMSKSSEKMYSLKLIRSRSLEKFSQKNLKILLEILRIVLINSCDDPKKLKLCSECVNTLEKLASSSGDDIKYDIISICLDPVTKAELGIQTQLLRVLRNQMSTNFSQGEMISSLVCDKMKEVIMSGLESLNSELVDSCLEVLTAMVKQNNIVPVNDEQLVKFLLKIWNLCRMGSLDVIVSCSLIPLLFAINFFATNQQLADQGLERHKSILCTIVENLSKKEEDLKQSCIQAVKFFIPKFIFNQSQSPKLADVYSQFIGIPLSQTALSETDDEIISMIIEVWKSIIDSIREEKKDIETVLRIFFESGVFTVLKTIFEDPHVLPSTKIQAHEVLSSLRGKLAQFDYKLDDVLDDLDKLPEPELCIDKPIVSQPISNDNKRDEILEEIFGESDIVPTQSLIDQLVQRSDNDPSGSTQVERVDHPSFDELADLLSTFTIAEEKSQGEIGHGRDLLNDIILAKDYKRSIPSDCY